MNSNYKIKECLRTKIVYVKTINPEQLRLLQLKGFLVRFK